MAEVFKQKKSFLFLQSNAYNNFHYVLSSTYTLFKHFIFPNKKLSKGDEPNFLERYGIPVDYSFSETLGVGSKSNKILGIELTNALTRYQKQLKSAAPSPMPPMATSNGSQSSLSSTIPDAAESKTSDRSIRSSLTSGSPSPLLFASNKLAAPAKTPAQSSQVDAAPLFNSNYFSAGLTTQEKQRKYPQQKSRLTPAPSNNSSLFSMFGEALNQVGSTITGVVNALPKFEI